MGQVLDPTFVAAINSRAYAALSVPRRNAGNTGYEFARAGFPDAAQTWAQTQTFTVAPVFTDAAGTRTALGLGTLATQSGTFPQTITLTGDVTGSGTGSFAATLAASQPGTHAWAAQQVFLCGAAGGTPLIVRQTGGVAGTSEVQVYHDGTDGYVVTKTGTIYVTCNNSSGLEITASSGLRVLYGGTPYLRLGLGNSSILDSGHVWGWASGGPTSSSIDVALTRSAANTFKITDGSSGFGSLLCGQGTFLSGTAGQTPFIVRQTGGTPGTNELQVWNDGSNCYLNGQQNVYIGVGGNFPLLVQGFAVIVTGGADLSFSAQNTGISWNGVGLRQINSAATLKITDGSSGFGSLLCGQGTFQAPTSGTAAVFKAAATTPGNIWEAQTSGGTVHALLTAQTGGGSTTGLVVGGSSLLNPGGVGQGVIQAQGQFASLSVANGSLAWFIVLSNNVSGGISFYGSQLGVEPLIITKEGQSTFVAAAANVQPLIVKGAASRTATLLQLQTSAGGLLGNVGGTIFTDYADGASTSTDGTFDTLYTHTTVANTFANNGDTLRGRVALTLIGSATATREIKLVFAGVTLLDTTALTDASNANVVIDYTIIRVSATVVRYAVTVDAPGLSAVVPPSVGEVTGLTLTGTNILKVTGAAAGTGALAADIVALSQWIDRGEAA